jgi:hypothetical protein
MVLPVWNRGFTVRLLKMLLALRQTRHCRAAKSPRVAGCGGSELWLELDGSAAEKQRAGFKVWFSSRRACADR